LSVFPLIIFVLIFYLLYIFLKLLFSENKNNNEKNRKTSISSFEELLPLLETGVTMHLESLTISLTKTCTDCNTSNNYDANYCQGCGAELISEYDITKNDDGSYSITKKATH